MYSIDARQVEMAWKAMQYDRLKAKTPQTREKVEKVKAAKPGAASSSPPRAKKIGDARDRLRKTGSVNDAAALFEQML